MDKAFFVPKLCNLCEHSPCAKACPVGATFDTPDGRKTLLDLFDGRRQLVLYQFMDNGPDDYCPGCTHFTKNVADLGTLADTSFIK